MLLHQRDLGLHRELDVGKRWRDPWPERRYAGQNPRRALLVHEAARTVDGVDQHHHLEVVPCRLCGEDLPAVVPEPLGDQEAWIITCDRCEALEECRLGDPVDRENGVSRVVADHAGEGVGVTRFADREHLVANRLVDRSETARELVQVTEHGSPGATGGGHTPWARRSCQRYACSMIVSSAAYLGFHFKSSAARRGFATSSGGSPARRPTSRAGTLRPVTFSTVSRTSRTECPCPVPRLTLMRRRAAREIFERQRCASAESTTWM